MKKVIGNAVVFVLLYVLFMIPTYLLPYIGSNSSLINAAGVSSGAGMNPAFWLHLIALVVLVLLAWFRGVNVGKTWLIAFPIVALLFDLTPVLNNIPLIPTVMHVFTIIVGIVGTGEVASEASEQTISQ